MAAAPHRASQQKRLVILLGLNVSLMAGLILVGLFSHSIGVLAAGADFIADALAIVLGLIAIHLRDRHQKPKAPAYIALINACLLLGMTGLVIFESIMRLIHHNPEIHGLSVMVISLFSAVVMGVGAMVLGRDAQHEDLHMRSVLLDTISDGLAAIAVAVVGAVIYFTGRYYWLDSIVALGISLYIVYGAVRLLLDVITSLRSHTP